MTRLSERALGVSQIRQWTAAGRVFAVLDGCGTPSVPERLRDRPDWQAASLYRGRAEEELWGIAPYLVHLDPPLLEWITTSLWATPWGIFAVADTELETLRSHFRKFLVVESPGGEPWYFRFYDPRVLPRFLAACTDDELTELFGPVRAFGVTDPASYGVRLLLNQTAGPATPDRPPTVKVIRR